jgi:metal-responsive CopG/Arc/MetJ family transcriptional regulator
MPTYSVRASGNLADEIEAFADAYDGSRSDALRELLRRGTAYEDIQRDRDRLQNAQTQLIEHREENQELVEYVKEQRSIEREREDRQRERESANIVRRTWWAIAGRPTGDRAAED